MDAHRGQSHGGQPSTSLSTNSNQDDRDEDDEDEQMRKLARQFAIKIAPECVEGFVRWSSIVSAETPTQTKTAEDFALWFANQFTNIFMEAMGVSTFTYSLKLQSEHRDAASQKKSAWSGFKAAVKHRLLRGQSFRSPNAIREDVLMLKQGGEWVKCKFTLIHNSQSHVLEMTIPPKAASPSSGIALGSIENMSLTSSDGGLAHEPIVTIIMDSSATYQISSKDANALKDWFATIEKACEEVKASDAFEELVEGHSHSSRASVSLDASYNDNATTLPTRPPSVPNTPPPPRGARSATSAPSSPETSPRLARRAERSTVRHHPIRQHLSPQRQDSDLTSAVPAATPSSSEHEQLRRELAQVRRDYDDTQAQLAQLTNKMQQTESTRKAEVAQDKRKVKDLQTAYEDIVHQLMMTQRQLEKLRQYDESAEIVWDAMKESGATRHSSVRTFSMTSEHDSDDDSHEHDDEDMDEEGPAHSAASARNIVASDAGNDIYMTVLGQDEDPRNNTYMSVESLRQEIATRKLVPNDLPPKPSKKLPAQQAAHPPTSLPEESIQSATTSSPAPRASTGANIPRLSIPSQASIHDDQDDDDDSEEIEQLDNLHYRKNGHIYTKVTRTQSEDNVVDAGGEAIMAGSPARPRSGSHQSNSAQSQSTRAPVLPPGSSPLSGKQGDRGQRALPTDSPELRQQAAADARPDPSASRSPRNQGDPTALAAASPQPNRDLSSSSVDRPPQLPRRHSMAGLSRREIVERYLADASASNSDNSPRPSSISSPSSQVPPPLPPARGSRDQARPRSQFENEPIHATHDEMRAHMESTRTGNVRSPTHTSQSPAGPPSAFLLRYDWFHPNITREDSCRIVLTGPPGSYLVRDSGSQADCLTLTINWLGYPRHLRIQLDGQQCTIGTYVFDSIFALIANFKTFPFPEDLRPAELASNEIKLTRAISKSAATPTRDRGQRPFSGIFSAISSAVSGTPPPQQSPQHTTALISSAVQVPVPQNVRENFYQRT